MNAPTRARPGAVRRIAAVVGMIAACMALGACGERRDAAPVAGGDAERGRLALKQYACHACHRIPGITGSDVHVGPPLKGLAARKYLAGRLPNTPDNLVRWIRDPKLVDPLTAMPKMNVSEAEAIDMAAYLLTMD